MDQDKASSNFNFNFNFKFKAVFLGEGRVGKTSILVRFLNNEFDDNQQQSLSASCVDRKVDVGSSKYSVTLSLWDTAGQERFHSLAPMYYRDADAALVVYDITDSSSFERVKMWVEELRRTCTHGTAITLFIVGNKGDLERNRRVDQDEVERYTKEVGAYHHITSAKTGMGIEDLFSQVAKRLVEVYSDIDGTQNGHAPSQTGTVRNGNGEQNSQNGGIQERGRRGNGNRRKSGLIVVDDVDDQQQSAQDATSCCS